MQTRTFSAFQAIVVRQATVEVRVGSKDGPLATGLLNENGSPLDNPFQISANGRATFQAETGDYWVHISGPGFDVWEPAQFLDVADVLAVDAAKEAAEEAAEMAVEAAAGAAEAVTLRIGDGDLIVTTQGEASVKVLSEDFKEFTEGFFSDDGKIRMTFDPNDYDRVLIGTGLRVVSTEPENEDFPELRDVLWEDSANKVRVGWYDDNADPENSGLVFEPSTQTAKRIVEKADIPIVTPGQIILRTGQVASYAYETSGYTIGTVSTRWGYNIETTQREDTIYEVAVIRSLEPMLLCCGMGQSNAGTGGVTGENPRLLVEPQFPNTVFGMGVSGSRLFITGSASSVQDLSGVNDLMPYCDGTSGAGVPQSQGTMTAYGAAMAYLNDGTAGPGILCHVDFYGGQSIATFMKGTATYTNFINHHVKLKEMAALYGRDAMCKATFFTQGESGSIGYEEDLDELCTDLRTDLQVALEQDFAPVILLHQVNHSATEIDYDPVPLYQLAVAASRPTQVKIAGPMYQCKLADDIHLTAESRMMLGAVDGEVFRRVCEGEGWSDFKITDVSRSDEVIELTYATPTLTGLEFDPGPGQPGDGWVKPVENHGFFYEDDSSGAEIDIVEIIPGTGGRLNKIRITLDSNPGSATGKVLRYARGDDPSGTDPDGWPAARGGVRCRGNRNWFRQLGYDVPEFNWFYACIQEVSVP